MQKPRIPPHPTTKQEILFLRRMGFPAQKKMNSSAKTPYKNSDFPCLLTDFSILISSFLVGLNIYKYNMQEERKSKKEKAKKGRN